MDGGAFPLLAVRRGADVPTARNFVTKMREALKRAEAPMAIVEVEAMLVLDPEVERIVFSAGPTTKTEWAFP